MKLNTYYSAFIALSLSVLLFSCEEKESIAPTENEKDTAAISPCIPSGLESNTIAFYAFGNGSLKDVSGNGHDLLNPTTASPGMDRSGNADCAYYFNAKKGSKEFLIATDTKFLDSLPRFSISLWYKPTDSSRKGSDYEVLINRDLSTVHCPDVIGQWSVSLYDCRKAVFSRNNSVWDTHITANSTGNTCGDEVNIRTGSWHHLAVTFDNSNNEEMKIYRDGILQDTKFGVSCSKQTFDIGDLFIGQLYTGSIDDILIFDKTLSQTEVNDVAAMGACCDGN